MEHKKNMYGPVRTMRRMAVIAVMALVSLSSYAQSKVFEKLAKIEGVERIHFDKNMIRESLDQTESPIQDSVSLKKVKDDMSRMMDDITIFTCKEATGAAEMKKSVQKLLKGNQWQTLIDMNRGGHAFKICQSKQDEQTTTVILVSEYNKATNLMVIDGRFDMTQLAQLMGKIEEMQTSE